MLSAQPGVRALVDDETAERSQRGFTLACGASTANSVDAKVGLPCKAGVEGHKQRDSERTVRMREQPCALEGEVRPPT